MLEILLLFSKSKNLSINMFRIAGFLERFQFLGRLIWSAVLVMAQRSMGSDDTFASSGSQHELLPDSQSTRHVTQPNKLNYQYRLHYNVRGIRRTCQLSPMTLIRSNEHYSRQHRQSWTSILPSVLFLLLIRRTL